MYTRQEIAKHKQAFWTTFGKYIQPVLSANGEPVNWMNYKTGVNGIQFKMDGDQWESSVGIHLVHASLELQKETYEKLEGFKAMLEDILEEEWEWRLLKQDEYGKIKSTVATHLYDVNLYDRKNWPALITFFKSRIVKLDEWWVNAKPFFE